LSLAAGIGQAAGKDRIADDRKPAVVQLQPGKTTATVKVGEVVYCGVREEFAQDLRGQVPIRPEQFCANTFRTAGGLQYTEN
jgi:hypothetical protein